MSLIIDGSSGITFPDSSKISNTKSLFSTGNTASRPSNPTLGTLYYNTENDSLENYTGQGWLKVSVTTLSVTSITGTIYSGNTSTLSFSGSGFGAVAGIVNFVSGAVSSSVTISSLTDTTATVSVPASIYGLGSGNTVNITLTNSDGVVSGITQKTVQGLPTGGTITTSGNNRIHSFTSSNTFVVPTGFTATANYLVVAGGGGGGSDMGGGGGAGGVLSGTTSISVGSYSITVGSGGNGAPAGTGTVRGTNGNNSIFNNLTAIGGGGGASTHNTGSSPAGNGGSGGGATPTASRGLGTAGQGNDGGAGAGQWYPGGGGGAGAVGTTNPATGGVGIQSSITGVSYFWGGGGGGSGYSGIGGNGGNGGGGGGAIGVTTGGAGLNSGSPGGGGSAGNQSNTPGGNAGANTGGGGGGGSHYNSNNYGGNGGSGIVIISYQLS